MIVRSFLFGVCCRGGGVWHRNLVAASSPVKNFFQVGFTVNGLRQDKASLVMPDLYGRDKRQTVEQGARE